VAIERKTLTLSSTIRVSSFSIVSHFHSLISRMVSLKVNSNLKFTVVLACVLTVQGKWENLGRRQLFSCPPNESTFFNRATHTFGCTSSCPTFDNCHCTRDSHCDKFGSKCSDAGQCFCDTQSRLLIMRKSVHDSLQMAFCLPLADLGEDCEHSEQCTVVAGFCSGLRTCCVIDSQDQENCPVNVEVGMECTMDVHCRSRSGFCDIATRTCACNSDRKLVNITRSYWSRIDSGISEQVEECDCLQDTVPYDRVLQNGVPTCVRVGPKVGDPCLNSRDCTGMLAVDGSVKDDVGIYSYCREWENGTRSCQRSSDDGTCVGMDDYERLWRTPPNTRGRMDCPSLRGSTDGIGSFWDCGDKGKFLARTPDYTNCSSEWVQQIQSDLNVSEEMKPNVIIPHWVNGS
jgi:hypothetical protein